MTRFALFAVLALAACSTAPLTTTERTQYTALIDGGAAPAEEYSPTLGAFLGVLPGGGSFYCGQGWAGFAGFLMWPLSVVWEIPNAVPTTSDMNARATIERASRDPE